ncbi:hypothetical protein G6F42_024948 [Rhizopus arrhizus]|nr:hypothetical protein G6F42_024948 [Rhizopus arrhizus]
MTSTLSPTNAHYMNPMLHQYRKRVMLKRSTHQINDPVVVQQKYTSNKKSVRFHDDRDQLEQVRYFFKTQSPITVKSDPPFMDSSADDYKLTQPNWPTRNQIFYNTESKIRMEAVQLMDGDVEHMAENKFIIQGRYTPLIYGAPTQKLLVNTVSQLQAHPTLGIDSISQFLSKQSKPLKLSILP